MLDRQPEALPLSGALASVLYVEHRRFSVALVRQTPRRHLFGHIEVCRCAFCFSIKIGRRVGFLLSRAGASPGGWFSTALSRPPGRFSK